MTREPPSPQRVARRALALASVVERGWLEEDAFTDAAKAEAGRASMLTWLARTGLAEELEPEERDLLESPVGTVDPNLAARATWRAEGLGVLAWALRRLALPPHDEPVDARAAIDSVGWLGDDAGELVAAAALRDRPELEVYAEQALNVHWRFRQLALVPEPFDFHLLAGADRLAGFDIPPLRLLEDDLAVGNRPISKAAAADRNACWDIAVERHQAAMWLLGDEELYSRVDLST